METKGCFTLLFTMETGTHRSNNRLVVEKQEANLKGSGISSRLERCPETCASVCVRAPRDKHSCKNLSSPLAHKLVHRQTNRCKSALACYLPQWLLSLGVYTLVLLISK